MIAPWRGRARLLAHAEHELRGALTELALEAPQLDLGRARAALDDLAAARAGRPALARIDAVRVDRLVWSVVARADLAARRAGGAVRLDWRAGEVTVRADRDRLVQALANLLDNAIEHGGAWVTVSGRRTRGGVRIVVSDSGPQAGPPAALHDAGRGGRRRGAGGAGGRDSAGGAQRGHGLVIAASAAGACGGCLDVVPARRGTSVALEIPA